MIVVLRVDSVGIGRGKSDSDDILFVSNQKVHDEGVKRNNKEDAH